VTADLMNRAKSGDGEAFGELVDRYRRELQVHCYRILGSAADAEDVLQETLLAAWQSFDKFEERASVRTWLYRIATNRSLNTLRSASRRPPAEPTLVWTDAPEPARATEVPWLEPYPDVLLDPAAGPEATYERNESVSLAFIAALQLLPPNQRTALVLRDVLGFSSTEAAEILETTTASITGALQRARATLAKDSSPTADMATASEPSSDAEAQLVAKLVQAFADGDVEGVVALLTDDVWLAMPPVPFEYQGHAAATRGLSLTLGAGRAHRLVQTRANGQPAFGVYVRDTHSPVFHANGLMVITLSGTLISAMTRFDNSNLARFGLPRTLPA
jgi:RNA polymerase sigma-70 factor (TIGR02960 family)